MSATVSASRAKLAMSKMRESDKTSGFFGRIAPIGRGAGGHLEGSKGIRETGLERSVWRRVR